MGDGGFDLSPAIDLLRVLSARPSLPTADSPSESYAYTCAQQQQRHQQQLEEFRLLGDFSPLWRLLGAATVESGGNRDTGQVPLAPGSNSQLPPPPLPQPPTPPPPPPPPPLVSGLHSPQKKPRRVVTFAVSADAGFSINDHPADPVPTSGGGKNRKRKKGCAFAQPLKTASLHDVAPAGGVPPSRPASIKAAASLEERKARIIRSLMTMFPEARQTLLNPPLTPARSPPPPGGSCIGGIHVFIDNSNILIGFYNHIKRLRGIKRDTAVRRPAFSFHNLTLVLERGRATAKRALVGSSPITPAVLEARELGYETSILERVEKERAVHAGASGGSASSGSESSSPGGKHRRYGKNSGAKDRKRKVEQSVDETLALKILETILDYKPSTIVLASGDGAQGEYSPGFFRVVERCLSRGWHVELVAFKASLSHVYRDADFRRRWEKEFRFIPLDHFAEDLLG